MQNVFVENTDQTQDIHIEDSAAIQYSIVIEDVADDNIIAELPISGISNIVVDYTPGIEYDIVIQHAIQNVDELGLPIPDDDGQILAGDLDGDLYWIDQYTHPSYASINQSANTGQVIDTFISNTQGHATSLSLRYLQAADIPILPISKITGLQTELNNRYTETELQTSGDAEVHWGNLTNVPSTLSGSHSDLDGLDSDDHLRYALLSGRSGDTLSIDTVGEFTSANGVWIDGLGIKDTGINFEVGATTRIFKDGLTNLSFTDTITGTKTLAELAAGNPSPLTTKGDLYTFSTVNTRLPVGTNGYVLTVDSAEATGLKWAAASGGVSFGTDNQIPHMNSGGADFDYDSNFTWNGTRLYMEDGNDNIYIGSNTGYINTDRIHNIAIGTLSGAYVKGDYNTFIGAYAAAYSGAQTYDHSGLTVIGSYAANKITTGEYSTFLGVNCGREFQTGTNCTYIGHSAGYNNDSGDYNTYIGHGSGYTGTGSSNVFLGTNSGYYETGSNKLFIDNSARTNEATARTNAMFYGIFNTTVASQEIHLNAGIIMIDDIPTSDPSNTGQIWNDSGTLKVSV